MMCVLVVVELGLSTTCIASSNEVCFQFPPLELLLHGLAASNPSLDPGRLTNCLSSSV